MINFKHIKLLLAFILLPFKVGAFTEDIPASVGTLDGQLSVNDMGAAIYSVPLELFPSGTGFDPQIGIAYNSQLSGYGNVGYGVNITGLSSITRAGKDLFHDNKVEKIRYCKGDTYLLDGKRLILKSGSYGYDNATYTIEGNPYVTVTQKGDDNHSTTSFIYTDANGTTYEYGETQLVIIGNANRTIAWYLKKAKNKYGDSIDYKYMTDNRLLYPSEITYGRNGERHKVIFVYAPLTKAQKFVFEGGCEGYFNRRLTRIISYKGNSIYRRYDFSYETFYGPSSDNSARKFDRLTNITVYNNANEAFEPLTFNWQYLKSAAISDSTYSITTFNRFCDYGSNNNKKYDDGDDIGTLFSADLNGDGISDIVRIAQGHEMNSVVRHTFVYISCSNMDSQGGVTYPDTIRYDIPPIFALEDLRKNITSSASLNGLCSGDIDGDGIDDLIFPIYSNDDFDPTSNLTFFYILGKDIKKKDTRWKLEDNSLGFYLKTKGECAPYLLTDFDGDGKTDILYVEDRKCNSVYFGGIITDICGSPRFYEMRFTFPKKPNDKIIKKMYSADCNADGLADVILIFDDHYKIYYNNGVSNLSKTFSEVNSKVEYNSELKNYWRMEQGDFDGDGLLDFVCYDGSQLFFMRNRGNGTFVKTGSVNFKSLDIDNYFAIRVADFDKDGRSDFMISTIGGLKSSIVGWFISDGDKPVLYSPLNKFNNNRRDSYEPYIFTGDFDGDGYAEIANYGSLLNKDSNIFKKNTINIYKFPTDVSLGRVSSIMNGFGKTTTITYASGTNRKVYETGDCESDAYPVNTYTIPLPLVSQVSETYVDQDSNIVSYTYGGLKVHIAGRGTLGFTKKTVVNSTMNSTTESEIDWHESHWTPKTVCSKTTIDSKTSTSTTSYVEPITIGNNYFTYPSNVVATDMYGHTTERQCKYNTNYGLPSEEIVYYDNNKNMYKKTTYSGFVSRGVQHLPTVVKSVQRYSSSTLPYYTDKKITYWDKGEVSSVTTTMYEKGKSSVVLTTQYGIDEYGHVTSEITKGDNVTEVTKKTDFDEKKLRAVKTYTSPSSSVIEYEYDAWNRVSAKKDASCSTNILTTSYTYDNWGNLIKTVYPDGTSANVTTEWQMWDDYNCGSIYKTVTTATAQAPITVYYDAKGREVCTSTIGLDGANIMKVTHYDSKGNIADVVSTTGRLKTASTMSYDAFCRLTSQTDSVENSVYTSVKNSYDDRKTTVTTPTGTKRTTFDAWGNPILVEDIVNSKVATTIKYKYNSMGKPVSVTSNGNTITMTYDGAGNRIQLVDPDAGTMSYTYAADGTILSQTDAKGVVTKYIYDELGRIKKTRIGSTFITNYYKDGGYGHLQLEEQSMNGYVTKYEYDQYGRIKTEKRSTDKATLINTYKYNPNGQLSEKTYTGGLTVSYSYDKYGYNTQITANGQVVYKAGQFDGYTTSSTFLDKLISKTTRRFYPGEINTERQTCKGSANFPIDSNEEWHESSTGNLLSRQKNFDTPDDFEYDSFDRLIKVTRPDGTGLEMTYDKYGTMTYKSDMGNYNYDNEEHKHAVSSVTDCVSSKIYDYNRVSTDFNDFGKISSVYDDHSNMRFYYGPDLQRWRSYYSNASGKSWEALYFDDYERTTENGRIREFYYICDNVIIIRENLGAFKPYLVFKDGLGSILTVRDENATKVFDATYDVWGKQTIKINDIGLMRGYTGHEHVYGYEFINMNGRIYDPILAQFLSPDNYVQAPTNSQNFNRYSYCINNPLKYTDPSGNLWGIDDAALIFAAASLYQSVATAAVQGQNVWKAAGMSVLTSAASYGLRCITSSATNAIGSCFGHETGSWSTELARACAHGLVNGTSAAVSNVIAGNGFDGFGSGFATGFASSLVGSGVGALGWSSDAIKISMSMTGGLTAELTGRDFITGFQEGYSIAALNHTWVEDGIRYCDDNPSSITGDIPELVCTPGYTIAPSTYVGFAGIVIEKAAPRSWNKYLKGNTQKISKFVYDTKKALKSHGIKIKTSNADIYRKVIPNALEKTGKFIGNASVGLNGLENLVDVIENRRIGLGNVADFGIAVVGAACPQLAIGYLAVDALTYYATGSNIRTHLNGMMSYPY